MWRFNRDTHKRMMQNRAGKRDIVYDGVKQMKIDYNDNKLRL